ncbi:serine carboxypeptidase S28 [Colletotrichum chrysophilum]|uniref:Serine carboxypeptidase S28 n=1 Tax=Colletotrichum chrysophilum TaxID=1836956 RepID=A0AAD9EG58_9PEZI|nr:serine carboxypeptidase S28 [Colletotrichum chrysophilum]
MVNVGEADAEEYAGWHLTKQSLAYLYAEKFQGAVVLFEHRYYGKSQPFKTITAETCSTTPFLNRFKTTSALPKFGFDNCGGANVDKSPCVLIGGSYAGALAARQSVITPGVMPRNCSEGVKLVIKKVDSILSKGDRQEIAEMKKEFGVALLNDVDFASTLTKIPPDSFSYVSEFCNHMEKTRYWKDFCIDTPCDWEHEKEIEFPSSPTNLGTSRSWAWQLCNEFGWWHIGPPQSDGNNIVSSHLTSERYKRHCDDCFLEVNGFRPAMSRGTTADDFNKWTKGGWDAPFEKVMFVDGEFDMWNSATMSSVYRPGSPWNGTEEVPRMVVARGGRIPDLDLLHMNEDVVEALAVVTKKQLKIMEKWLSEWKPEHL